MPVIEAAGSKALQQLQSARAESDRLFEILQPEAMFERPIAERHRVIFYVGHLDGFDSIQICREGLGLKSPDAELDACFRPASIRIRLIFLATRRPIGLLWNR